MHGLQVLVARAQAVPLAARQAFEGLLAAAPVSDERRQRLRALLPSA